MKKIICKFHHFVKSNIHKTLSCLLLTAVLSGCGEKKPDSDLEAYRTDMSAFGTTIAQISVSINGIDPAAENADEVFLSDLDLMNNAFRDMAALQVPEEYSDAGTLAYEAAAYMNDAVSLYHEAYGADGYSETLAEQARTQYESAMERISSIGTLFMQQ
ncbi:MAG: hypothetical protein IJ600_11335 [Lachnospiraceae bacterium]|nr:hypothetical protein [Lachnospiraceae bacterium]